MNFKFSALLTFVLSRAITATPTGNLLGNGLAEESAGDITAQHIGVDNMNNMNKINATSECANFEFNCGAKILHYRDGKADPSCLARTYERQHQTNFTDTESCQWEPYKAIFFGSEKPLNMTGRPSYCEALMLASQKDHLRIFSKRAIGPNDAFTFPVQITENERPMNGFIFPWGHPDKPFSNPFSVVGMRYILLDESCQYLVPRHLKFAIVINNEGEEKEIARKRALEAAENILLKSYDTQICIVAQPDKRSVERKFEEEFEEEQNGQVLLFHGDDLRSSILVVEKTDTEETLKAKFEDWKEELSFLDSHQTVAFHFTMIYGIGPINSEDLFSETFPNVPLSTLSLLDESTIGVVNKNGVRDGAVYAILGYPKI